MSEIFFTADDLGLTAEASNAMLHAHLHGALHGAALMLGQPGTDHAVALARKHPTLAVGFHLHLCDSRPLTLGPGGWPWGDDPARAGWAIGTSRQARRIAEAEVARQWEEFCATGLPCAFVNAHHHLHVHPFVMEMLKDVLGAAPEPSRRAWWRWGRPMWFGASGLRGALASAGWAAVRAMSRPPTGAASPSTLWGIDRSFCMQAAEVRVAVQNIRAATAVSPSAPVSPVVPQHEFLFHPRCIHLDDKDLQALLALRDVHSAPHAGG
ncbi:PTS cellobiose transporter [Verrucomicrobia bacterium LW23]|nr:PTS cellobiose transporter [Verrucomicrobia bacterium LW23]